MALISANCIICERAIQEKDDVISAFRIIDLFFANPVSSFPIEQQEIPITFVGFIRLTEDDDAEHVVGVRISGPNREPSVIPIGEKKAIPGKFPGLPRQAALLGQIGVIPHLGAYELVLLFDGEEVAKTQFILAW